MDIRQQTKDKYIFIILHTYEMKRINFDLKIFVYLFHVRDEKLEQK